MKTDLALVDPDSATIKVVATAKLATGVGSSQGAGGSLSREYFFDLDPTVEELAEIRKQMRDMHESVYRTNASRVAVDLTIRRVT